MAVDYPVAPDKVWRAWTEPQALSHWFGPGDPDSVTRAELDLRVGGRLRISFRTQDGEEHDVSGVYQEVVENRRLGLEEHARTCVAGMRASRSLVMSGEGCDMVVEIWLTCLAQPFATVRRKHLTGMR